MRLKATNYRRPIRLSVCSLHPRCATFKFFFVEKYDVLAAAEEGATFLLNSPFPVEEVWNKLPRTVQEQIICKRVKFYCINAYEVARANQMGTRINTIMQTCFFAISNVLPRAEAIAQIKRLRPLIGAALADSLLTNDQTTEEGINAQRELVAALKAKLNGSFEPDARDLLSVADALVQKSVWIGGAGWAYDIGYGGLDHVRV